MTALSGHGALILGTRRVYRIGVGIGEASASPAAYSMLSDYYHPRASRHGHPASTPVGRLHRRRQSGLFLGGSILGFWADTGIRIGRWRRSA